MITAWYSFILLGISGIFGHHVWNGWRSGEVRFPLAILVFQEFERYSSPMNFWAIMVLDGIVSAVALATATSSVWGLILYSEKPISTLSTLTGCYEGVGLPDFMRPPHHWALRITDGAIISREGMEMSKIRLRGSTPNRTHLEFSPGILVSGKPETVFAGDTMAGEAYIGGDRVTIVMSDDWGNVMQATSCR